MVSLVYIRRVYLVVRFLHTVYGHLSLMGKTVFSLYLWQTTTAMCTDTDMPGSHRGVSQTSMGGRAQAGDFHLT